MYQQSIKQSKQQNERHSVSIKEQDCINDRTLSVYKENGMSSP